MGLLAGVLPSLSTCRSNRWSGGSRQPRAAAPTLCPPLRPPSGDRGAGLFPGLRRAAAGIAGKCHLPPSDRTYRDVRPRTGRCDRPDPGACVVMFLLPAFPYPAAAGVASMQDPGGGGRRTPFSARPDEGRCASTASPPDRSARNPALCTGPDSPVPPPAHGQSLRPKRAASCDPDPKLQTALRDWTHPGNTPESGAYNPMGENKVQLPIAFPSRRPCPLPTPGMPRL